jgi:predicted transcriptional regulator
VPEIKLMQDKNLLQLNQISNEQQIGELKENLLLVHKGREEVQIL